MLNNIPPILSPELLKVLCEMGHGDRICIGDGNFPGVSMAKPNNCVFLRADGHGVPELLDAILQVIPLDEYVEHPVMIMQVAEKDKGLEVHLGRIQEDRRQTRRARRGRLRQLRALRVLRRGTQDLLHPAVRRDGHLREHHPPEGRHQVKNSIKNGRITQDTSVFLWLFTPLPRGAGWSCS